MESNCQSGQEWTLLQHTIQTSQDSNVKYSVLNKLIQYITNKKRGKTSSKNTTFKAALEASIRAGQWSVTFSNTFQFVMTKKDVPTTRGHHVQSGFKQPTFQKSLHKRKLIAEEIKCASFVPKKTIFSTVYLRLLFCANPQKTVSFSDYKTYDWENYPKVSTTLQTGCSLVPHTHCNSHNFYIFRLFISYTQI